MKFVPNGPINNIPALVQIMAWRRPGDKPLSEPMMISLNISVIDKWMISNDKQIILHNIYSTYPVFIMNQVIV